MPVEKTPSEMVDAFRWGIDRSEVNNQVIEADQMAAFVHQAVFGTVPIGFSSSTTPLSAQQKQDFVAYINVHMHADDRRYAFGHEAVTVADFDNAVANADGNPETAFFQHVFSAVNIKIGTDEIKQERSGGIVESKGPTKDLMTDIIMYGDGHFTTPDVLDGMWVKLP